MGRDIIAFGLDPVRVRFFFMFCLRFYVPVNSYGHVETVNSPNHTFSFALDFVIAIVKVTSRSAKPSLQGPHLVKCWTV